MKSFSVLLLSFFSLASVSQAPKSPPQGRPANAAIATITLGQSIYPLNGPWKFTVGDSPIDPATHQPLWAEPTFDDAHWETVDLTPDSHSISQLSGRAESVPGWTAKGHPGYSGYAWYRIRVKLNESPGEKLALEGPIEVDDGYQIFSNGTLLGSFGDFSSNPPVVYQEQPTLFPLPPPAADHSSDGTRVLAFRIWMEPSTLLSTPDAGGFHTAPLLGQASAVTAHYQGRWLALLRAFASGGVELLLFVLLAVLAFSLILFDRSDRVYYWIGAAFVLAAAFPAVVITGTFGQNLSGLVEALFLYVLLAPLTLAAFVMVWWVWFRLKRPAWVPKAIVVLTLLYMLGELFGEEIFVGLVSHRVAADFHLLSLIVRLALLALLVLIGILGIREQGREGWIALPGILLLGIARFQPELLLLHIRAKWFVFGSSITLSQVADILLVLALFILLLRRVLLSLHAQRQQALDIKQAAEVQQVILPEAHFTFPGLAIETEYRPAREVGGDFFQLIPHPTDGSLLIVAGDVTGKGLQAGMLVALLVGATRSTAELNPDPLFILEALNRRLLGRRSAQATAIALRIAPDGHATLANAGHIPPYLNGTALDMEGSLPLGMIDGAEFSVMHFQLAPHDKLVLISDGILEATDPKGNLFGFDRVAELLRNATPVKALADAAQLFGQEDDISLVALTRTA